MQVMEDEENRIENKKRRRTSMGMKGTREDRMERLGEVYKMRGGVWKNEGRRMEI